jgi:hypothetical protein
MKDFGGLFGIPVSIPIFLLTWMLVFGLPGAGRTFSAMKTYSPHLLINTPEAAPD